MTIRDELLNFKNEDGLIIVDEAEKWARNNPNSELYQSLEWDDVRAGRQFRLWQIRRLVAIYIVNDEGVRQVVSLSIDRINRNGGGYRGVTDVLGVRSLRDVMLADALAELERVQKKYDTLHELAQVWAAKDVVKKRRRTRPTEQPGAAASA